MKSIVTSLLLLLLLLVLHLLVSAASSSPLPGQIVEGQDVTDGDQVPVRRFIGDIAFSSSQQQQQQQKGLRAADPFIVFDFYNITSSSSSKEEEEEEEKEKPFATFKAHLHAGFVEIRYVLEGRLEHLDSCDVSGTVEEGGFHVFKTLGGIAHEEKLFWSNRKKVFRGFQLWIDVPEQVLSSHLPSYTSAKPTSTTTRTTTTKDFSLDVSVHTLIDNRNVANNFGISFLQNFVLLDVNFTRQQLQINKDNNNDDVCSSSSSPSSSSCSGAASPSRNRIFEHHQEQEQGEMEEDETCFFFATEGSFLVNDETDVFEGELFVFKRWKRSVSFFVSSEQEHKQQGQNNQNNNSNKGRFLFGCASPQKQKLFRWEGLVYHSREKLDKAVQELKKGNFKPKCAVSQ